MRIHPLFFALTLSCSCATAAAVDSYLSGEWKDGRIENRLELRESVGAGTGTAAFRTFLAERQGTGQEKEVIFGAEAILSEAVGLKAAVGRLKETGFLYSLSNPFGKSLHSGARLRPSSFSLDAGASFAAETAQAFAVELPNALPLSAGAGFIRREERRILIGSIGASNNGSALRFEGLYAEASLQARTSDTWFSERPPLPERIQHLAAGSLTADFGDTQWSISGAVTETEAMGRGMYAKATGDVGIGGFRAIIAGDASTANFVDLAGKLIDPTSRGMAAIALTIPRKGTASLAFDQRWDSQPLPARESRIKAAYRFSARPTASLFRPIEFNAEAIEKQNGPESQEQKMRASFRSRIGSISTTTKAEAAIDSNGTATGRGGSVSIDMPLKPFRASVAAGCSLEGADAARIVLSAGVAFAFRGGLLSTRFGTDSPSEWSRLTGDTPTTSPLGPWTLSVSWRFRERRKAGPGSVD